MFNKRLLTVIFILLLFSPQPFSLKVRAFALEEKTSISFEQKPLIRNKTDIKYFPDSFIDSKVLERIKVEHEDTHFARYQEVLDETISILQNSDNYGKTTISNLNAYGPEEDIYEDALIVFEGIIEEVKLTAGESPKEVWYLRIYDESNPDEVIKMNTTNPYSYYMLDLIFADYDVSNLPRNAVTDMLYLGDKVRVYTHYRYVLPGALHVELID